MKWRGLILALMLLPGMAVGLESGTETGGWIRVEFEQAGLWVELATTPGERRKGLSGRKELEQDRGMLFVWPDSAPRRFWMKDTSIPLSVAFLTERGRILNIARMEPSQTERTYPSQGPAKYALEVNRGWFARHGIGPGDRARLHPPGTEETGPSSDPSRVPQTPSAEQPPPPGVSEHGS